MRSDYNDSWEERMRNEGIPRSTEYIKAKLSMELEMYKAGKSSVNDSLEQINNPFAQSNGSDLEKNNVRVRTMEIPSYKPVSNMPVNNDQNQYYGGYSADTSYQSYTSSNGGNVSALVLVSIVALVILVVFVSLFVMKSVGF